EHVAGGVEPYLWIAQGRDRDLQQDDGRTAIDAAEKKRGAEEPAAETRADGYCGGKTLRGDEADEHARGDRLVERELDCAVAAARHLRERHRDEPDDEAAYHRARPGLDLEAAEDALDPGDAGHRRDRNPRRGEAEQRKEHVVETRDVDGTVE